MRFLRTVFVLIAVFTVSAPTLEELRERQKRDQLESTTILVENALAQRDAARRKVSLLKSQYEEERRALENRYHVAILNAQDAVEEAEQLYNHAVRAVTVRGRPPTGWRADLA